MSETRVALDELQTTPGLGQRAKCRVNKKTPLKRRTRVKTGVCGEIVPLRTPKKLETSRKKRTRPSMVEETILQVPQSYGPSMSLHVKQNPLYTMQKQQIQHKENRDPFGCLSVPCDGGRNPLFYGQRRSIRKTKEQEMIAAVIDLVQYSENSSVTRSRANKMVQKAKAIFGRHGKSSQLDITKQKSPEKKGAFYLRSQKRNMCTEA